MNCLKIRKGESISLDLIGAKFVATNIGDGLNIITEQEFEIGKENEYLVEEVERLRNENRKYSNELEELRFKLKELLEN